MGNGCSLCCCGSSSRRRAGGSPGFDDLDAEGAASTALPGVSPLPHLRTGAAVAADGCGGNALPSVFNGSAEQDPIPAAASDGRAEVRSAGSRDGPLCEGVVTQRHGPPRGLVEGSAPEAAGEVNDLRRHSAFSPTEGQPELTDCESSRRQEVIAPREKLIFASTAQMRNVQALIELQTKQRQGSNGKQGRKRRHGFRWRLVYSSNVHGFSSAELQARVKRVGAAHAAAQAPPWIEATGRAAAGTTAAAEAFSSTTVEVPMLLILETSHVVYQRDTEGTHESKGSHHDSRRGESGSGPSPPEFIVDGDAAEVREGMRPFHVCVGVYLKSLPTCYVKQFYSAKEGFLFSFCVPVRPDNAAPEGCAPAHPLAHPTDDPLQAPLRRQDSTPSPSPPPVSATRVKRMASSVPLKPSARPSQGHGSSHEGEMTGASRQTAEDADGDAHTEERLSRHPQQRPPNPHQAQPLLNHLPHWRAPVVPVSPVEGTGRPRRTSLADPPHDASAFASSFTSVSETSAWTMQTGGTSVRVAPGYGKLSAAAEGRLDWDYLHGRDGQPHFWHLRERDTVPSASLLSGTLVSVSSTEDEEDPQESISGWASASSSSSSAAASQAHEGGANGKPNTSRDPSLSGSSRASTSSSASAPSSVFSSEFPSSVASPTRPHVNAVPSEVSHNVLGSRHCGCGGGNGVEGRRYVRRPVLALTGRVLQRINPLFEKKRKGPTRRPPKKLCVLISEEGTLLVWAGDINKQPALILAKDLSKMVCHTELPILGDKHTAREFLRYTRKAAAAKEQADGAPTAPHSDRSSVNARARTDACRSHSPSSASNPRTGSFQKRREALMPHSATAASGGSPASPELGPPTPNTCHTDPSRADALAASATAPSPVLWAAVTSCDDGEWREVGDGPLTNLALPTSPMAAGTTHRPSCTTTQPGGGIGASTAGRGKEEEEDTRTGAQTPARGKPVKAGSFPFHPITRGSWSRRAAGEKGTKNGDASFTQPTNSRKFDFSAAVERVQVCTTSALL